MKAAECIQDFKGISLDANTNMPNVASLSYLFQVLNVLLASEFESCLLAET